MKDLSSLGKAIKHFASIQAISNYRLVGLSGIHEGTLRKLMRGNTSPTLYTLERIAKHLKINVSDIILYKESLDKIEAAIKDGAITGFVTLHDEEKAVDYAVYYHYTAGQDAITSRAPEDCQEGFSEEFELLLLIDANKKDVSIMLDSAMIKGEIIDQLKKQLGNGEI